MTIIEITRARAAAPRRGNHGGRRVLTPIETPERASTFTAPVRHPGGPTRPENWHAVSRDGLWRYDREDDTGTPWRVTYRPTGQTRDGYTTLNNGREDTADGTLLRELRAEALRGAVDRELAGDDRARAQGALGWFLRVAANDGADLGPVMECACGGLLVAIEYRGWGHLAHLAACRECWTPGAPGLAPVGDRCDHRACDTPRAVTAGRSA